MPKNRSYNKLHPSIFVLVVVLVLAFDIYFEDEDEQSKCPNIYFDDWSDPRSVCV